MAKINLLPWRQEVRERKNKEFLTLLVAVVLLSALAAFAGWSVFNKALSDQMQANEKIKQENASLDKALATIDSLEKQRDDIIARMKVIQDLQGRRPIPVRIWDDIARLIPGQMYLTNMKRVGDTITFTGQADNPTVVSNFMRSLDSSEWLENSAMISITDSATATVPTTTNGVPKVEYPEAKYITFVITTNVKKADVASTTKATNKTASGTTATPPASTAK